MVLHNSRSVVIAVATMVFAESWLADGSCRNKILSSKPIFTRVLGIGRVDSGTVAQC